MQHIFTVNNFMHLVFSSFIFILQFFTYFSYYNINIYQITINIIVLAAWKEPNKGWTVSKNGPQGFIMGASKGIVRRLPLKTSLIYDYIPVDIVVNTIIVSTWFSAKLPKKYNL